MIDLLADYERKRGRAKHHADVLADLVKRATDREPQRVKGELQLHTGQHKFDIPRERIDPDVAVVVGDWAYNTRASLDYLITALVRSTGNEEHTTSQFPIYTPGPRRPWETIDQWWDTAREVKQDLKDTPPSTKAALKPLQPFYGIPVTDWVRHPLNVLTQLNNRDKHRRLNLLAERASIDWEYADGQPVFDAGTPFPTLVPERREGDTYTVFLEMTPDKAHMDVYLLATHEIRLHEPPEIIGEIVEVLASIDQFIDARVFPTVRALL